MPVDPRSILAAVLLLGAAGFLGSCGARVEQDVADSSPSASVAGGEPISGDIAEFCSSLDVLDQTDGTTDAAFAVDALAEVRRIAPPEIRQDAVVVSDNIVINNYPSHVDPSMTETPVQEVSAASSRLGAYVDQHCDLED